MLSRLGNLILGLSPCGALVALDRQSVNHDQKIIKWGQALKQFLESSQVDVCMIMVVLLIDW